MTGAPNFRARLSLEPSGVRGSVVDLSDPSRRLAVELLVDGWPVDLARADAYAPEAADVGDGCYGFGFALPASVLDRGGSVEVRLANTGETIGDPLRIPNATEHRPAEVGRVTWRGGLRLTGWVGTTAAEGAGVTAVVERRVVARADARSWSYVDHGGIRTVVPAFDLRLPGAFADGRVHHVTVLDHRGQVLAGSPCAVLAFPDGLRRFLLERSEADSGDPRAAWIEKVVPQSVGFGEFEAWDARQPSAVPDRSGPAEVVVALIGSEVAASVASLRDQRDLRWVAVQVPEIHGSARFDPERLREVLSRQPAPTTVVLALAGTRFRPEALARLAAAVGEADATVYADAMVVEEGALRPLLWPAYDPERMLEQGYAALVFAAKPLVVLEALRRGAGSLFDVFLAAAEPGTAISGLPVHVPAVLTELPPLDVVGLGRTLAEAASRWTGASALPRADRPSSLPSVRLSRSWRQSGVSVAIIAPEPGEAAVDRVLDKLPRSVGEVLVVSHRLLAGRGRWRNVVVAGWRNPSRLRNAALAAASGDRLLLIDCGTVPFDPSAIDEMAGRLQAPGAAAVSGLLLGPDGVVLAAGAVLGVEFAAAPAFAGLRDGEPGYAGALHVARHCGALDAGCLMVDRAAAKALGGFDDLRFPEAFSGIDLSLRLRAAGRGLVFTPYARFLRGGAWASPPDSAQEAERTHLRERWGEDLLADPFYHPALNLDAGPFTGLAWPPRPRAPRRPTRPGIGITSRADDP